MFTLNDGSVEFWFIVDSGFGSIQDHLGSLHELVAYWWNLFSLNQGMGSCFDHSWGYLLLVIEVFRSLELWYFFPFLDGVMGSLWLCIGVMHYMYCREGCMRLDNITLEHLVRIICMVLLGYGL